MLEISYLAPPDTATMTIAVECQNDFYTFSQFPQRPGQGSRIVKGEMDEWCWLEMKAFDGDDKVVKRAKRKFFARGHLK